MLIFAFELLQETKPKTMITQINVENFKCFKEANIPFKNLTLLSGVNSVGKSSAIQPLLLLRNNHLNDSQKDKLMYLIKKIFEYYPDSDFLDELKTIFQSLIKLLYVKYDDNSIILYNKEIINRARFWEFMFFPGFPTKPEQVREEIDYIYNLMQKDERFYIDYATVFYWEFAVDKFFGYIGEDNFFYQKKKNKELPFEVAISFNKLLNFNTDDDVIRKNSNNRSCSISIKYHSIKTKNIDDFKIILDAISTEKFNPLQEVRVPFYFKNTNTFEFIGSVSHEYLCVKELICRRSNLSFIDEPLLSLNSHHFSGNRFFYVRAERLNPQISYIPTENSDDFGPLGKDGENTISFINRFKHEKCSNLKVLHPNEPDPSLIKQINAWLAEVRSGVEMVIKTNPKDNNFELKFVVNHQEVNISNMLLTPHNVGYGLTYVLPIIVALVAAPPDSMVILENPEAHLHPRGQSKLGELCARAAAGGVQVIVETHSDHLLNGVRVAVKRRLISPDDTQVNFFRQDLVDGFPATVVDTPKIDSDGRIDYWPEGFFDEHENMLFELLSDN